MKLPEKVGTWLLTQAEEYLEMLAQSYKDNPRRTCPGGYDYAGHDCAEAHCPTSEGTR